MKRILYLITLFLITGSTVATYAGDNKQIHLTAKEEDKRELPKEKDIEPGNIPVVRSITLQPVYAYIYNNVVSINFAESLAAVTVTITNEVTAEVVYSETCNSSTNFTIDLKNQSKGEYCIEITLNSLSLQGSFSL